MDEDKILRERKYDLAKVNAALDNFFLNTLHLRKGEDGFYLGSNAKTDFGNFGRAVWVLKKKAWFLDNVKTWLYFNSEDSDDPNDFVIEDFRDYCVRKYRATA
jgi:hypothetical protein